MHTRIKVADIELSQPIEDVAYLDGYQQLRALVRIHGVPIGYVDLPFTGATCHVQTISDAIHAVYAPTMITALLADRLAHARRSSYSTLEIPASIADLTGGETWPSLTVAICTHNRPADLARCLDALKQLDYPALDLLVVDNAPQNDASERLIRDCPEVRYVREDRRGLNWARNRAIAESRGAIIAFTDDDVVVDAGWAQAIGAVFAAHPDVMAVTGAIVPFELETEAQVLFERYGSFTPHFQRRWYRAGVRGTNHHHVGRFGSGANMAFRRALFDQLDGFDPALDVGTATNGGGDLEIFFRVLQEGHTLVFEPAALVRHRHRPTYAQLRQQIAGDGSGFTACLTRCALAYPSERAAILHTMRWWLGWMLRRLVRPEGIPRDLICAELYGALVGPARYIYAHRVVEALSVSAQLTPTPKGSVSL